MNILGVDIRGMDILGYDIPDRTRVRVCAEGVGEKSV